MPSPPRRRLLWLAGLILAAGCRGAAPEQGLGAPQAIAPGINLYKTGDSSLVNGAGPIAVYLLRLDPAHVSLHSALSNDQVLAAETVDAIARRLGAVAAINGGYFNGANGEPIGLLKVAGELVSDTRSAKGAVIIERPAEGPTHLTFDRLAARMVVKFKAGEREWTVPIDGVDTTRARGKLMLYTPAYHADTDTAPHGTEWILDGSPMRVTDIRSNFGHTVIPRNGAVLSFGGVDLPESLSALVEEVRVTFETTWLSRRGLPHEHLERAEDIVNGAGLLRQEGVVLSDWREEGLNPDVFTGARHPRTVVGVDREKFIWLIAVDGRQLDYSVGMTFEDLQRLCDRLHLVDALNLDGGGSTTMVVKGSVINRPSDPAGVRPVSDALVVMSR